MRGHHFSEKELCILYNYHICYLLKICIMFIWERSEQGGMPVTVQTIVKKFRKLDTDKRGFERIYTDKKQINIQNLRKSLKNL